MSSYIEENGYFIFDGIKSSDYGVWINGGGTFDAPKRRYKDYTVPGRNGTLTIDEGAFEEIEVVYPAFIARDFPANIEAFRNQLMARSGYVRMTDSYHPDEYYMAKYMDGLEADVLPAGVGGQFNLKFKRDPRRFLVSGETPSKYPADATSANNLIAYPYHDTTKTIDRMTFTDNGDRTITVSGNSTGTEKFALVSSNDGIRLPAGTYTAAGAKDDCYIEIRVSSGSGYYRKVMDWGRGTPAIFTITDEEAMHPYEAYIVAQNGTMPDNVVISPRLWANALKNPTLFKSRPQIKITPSDSGTKTVTIGSQTITVNSVGDYVIVDSEIQSCYRGTNNLNSQVSFNPNDFPVLEPGANNIAYGDGIESVEITPNWYRV